MMNLHKDTNAFKELIALSADYFGYEPSHVEKDYWVTKILHDVTTSEFGERTYFKGGTSLSKAYGVIDRFSEDLDLFVYTGNPNSSKQAEKNLNKNLSNYIVDCNKEMYLPDNSVQGGNYRKLCFSYDNLFRTVGLKDSVEVEIKSSDLMDKSRLFNPSDLKTITPIITKYLESIGRVDLIDRYSINGFKSLCVNPIKTICDKVSRLVRLSYKEDAVAQLAKHIRDVYDLMLLYHNTMYQAYIDSEAFTDDLRLVLEEDSQNKNVEPYSSAADAIIFKEPDSIMALPEIKSAYVTDLSKLLFGRSKSPDVSAAINVLSILHQRLSTISPSKPIYV